MLSDSLCETVKSLEQLILTTGTAAHLVGFYQLVNAACNKPIGVSGSVSESIPNVTISMYYGLFGTASLPGHWVYGATKGGSGGSLQGAGERPLPEL